MSLSRKAMLRSGPLQFSTVANTAVISVPSNDSKDQIVLGSVVVGNSAGANAACGYGYNVPNAMWLAGQYRANTTTLTNDTTDAQSSTAADFPMSTTTNNDGFVIQSLDRFDAVSFKLTTAGATGGIATPNYAYWSGAAWTAITPYLAADYTNTAVQVFALSPPANWTKFTTASALVAGTGFSAGYYGLKVAFATAPGTAPVADSLALTRLLDYRELVLDGAAAEFNLEGEMLIPHRALVPFCSVANAANWCVAEYTFRG